MAKFEGLRINNINQMEVGELYMYYHDVYSPNGVGFCLSEIFKDGDGTVFIGERCDGSNDRIAFDALSEQKYMNEGISALYLLSELKNANERN